MTITEFLLARFAEDAEAARVFELHYMLLKDPSGRPLASTEPLPARMTYTRALADCEAKRRIVQDIIDNDYYPAAMVTDGLSGRALHYLADVYADHPEYDPAWRP